MTGRCDLQDKLSDCMPEEVSYELKDSIEAMSEGMMNGELIDNLIMGLFNLNFAMQDFEKTLDDTDCDIVLTEIE